MMQTTANGMSAPTVLVAYGTRNGGTAGIAEIVGAALRADGLRVDVRNAAEVRDVAGYGAVVLGGALYNGHWHRDARRFAARHAHDLAGRPVWMFSSGPLDASADEREIPPVPQVVAIGERLAARGHVTFGGMLSEQAKGFIARAMARNGRGGDFRTEERIAAWAHSIANTVAAPHDVST
jgi:menaquinone-dependent protoporphyrinogen oxidase